MYINMKGYLKSSEGVFQLSPKVTTVGRDGCDLLIQTSGVDQQHAVIEFSEQENCFVLQDLNSAQGTYVNDCRVQNAAVRLAPGDIVRFGYNSMPYELDIDLQTVSQQFAYPPVQQKTTWNQPLTCLEDQYISTPSTRGLPTIPTSTGTPQQAWSPQGSTITPMPPHPPAPPTSLRARPLSAGARRPSSESIQRVGMAASPKGITGGGWIGPAGSRTTVTTIQPSRSAGSSPTHDILMMQEKEQKMLKMGDEINRLAVVEAESARKDQLIAQLQDENSRLRQGEGHMSMTGGDAAMTRKLMELENEVAARLEEVVILKEGLSKFQEIQSRNGPGTINGKAQEISVLKNELDKVKKDKNITSGLVTQMQRDMSNKDSTISRLTRELESFKKDIREKDVQLSAMQAKFSRIRDNKKAEDEKDARDKELGSLRHKFKSAENKIQDQNEVINTLKREVELVKLQVTSEKEEHKRTKSEMEHSKSQFLDMQRAERLVRVDLEQATKRYERFRNRVIQITYSTPGIKMPDGEINDDKLLNTLKKVIDERTELTRKVQDLKDNLRLANSTKKEVTKHLEGLKHHMMESENRLREEGRLCSTLKQEVNMLQSVSCDDTVQWVKDRLLNLLQQEMTWEHDIESALEKCGINVKVSSDEPGKHIRNLYAKWENSITEKEQLQARMKDMDSQYALDVAKQQEQLRRESENRILDAVEKARLEGEERMNRAIDEIRDVETEKRENALQQEIRKQEDLQNIIEQLRQSITEKNEEDEDTLESAKVALQQIEDYKVVEVSLREDLSKLEIQREAELKSLTEKLSDGQKDVARELQGYKEQIKQHSVTICAMEEKLVKVNKKSKDYQDEITRLKAIIQDLKKRPVPRAKPASSSPIPRPETKVIVQKNDHDIYALEQIVLSLRKENAESKIKIQDQQDVILALRRDLAGASARLQDMTGELSEAQKEELEQNKALVKRKEKELEEVRQQLAKLTQIIDKQSQELRQHTAELSKHKGELQKWKSKAEEREGAARDFEDRLNKEQNEQRKQLDMMQDEGRITSELTAAGAACHGERHEQVIARQREALAELRNRIKTLETVKPPVPTHDQALQQIAVLKKELAELRANQALAEDAHIQSATSLDREVSKARGMSPQTKAEVEIEKSAHRETLDTLEQSEETYLTLLRAVASCLEMEGIQGLRSMAHIPKDQRINLSTQREKACELLSSRIKVLKERIQRKDELLQTYERDLARLRQAEELATVKQSQVESLATDVRSRSDEAQYLRESLNRTRDRLEQERRLNNAIKQRKTFHMENENPKQGSWSKHQCPPTDLYGKVALKKKNQSEKFKRKNYEVTTLKTELSAKDLELRSASRRINSLETSLGLDATPQIFE